MGLESEVIFKERFDITNQFALMLEGSRKYCNWLSHQPGKAGAGKESIMTKYLKIFK